MIAFFTGIWSWVSGSKIVTYIVAALALAGTVALFIARVFAAGKKSEQVDELSKNSVIKDEQLQAATERPNSNSALDERLRDKNTNF